jgi:3-phosphoshikimate 1-carboxyvinyltransferase
MTRNRQTVKPSNRQTFSLASGQRKGTVTPPPSKSHLHRLLIAYFLAGGRDRLEYSPDDSADIAATRRCLRALAGDTDEPVFDCGESGSTLRFMRPIAAALGKRPRYVLSGRLAKRPGIIYDTIASGLHELPGDVSSQFATGLLFALPLLADDSEIRFTTPLESRGYVDLTLSVLASCGIAIHETGTGFLVPGGQRYAMPTSMTPERDWSGASFWLAMNALGSKIEVRGLTDNSAQPDRRIVELLAQTGGEKDMSQCPDIFPPLAIVAGAQGAATRFIGVRRLRLKESDRIASVADMLRSLGIATEEEEDAFTVHGKGVPYPGGVELQTYGDHRIAMSAAVAATAANGPLSIDNPDCAAKSYPGFFDSFAALKLV